MKRESDMTALVTALTDLVRGRNAEGMEGQVFASPVFVWRQVGPRRVPVRLAAPTVYPDRARLKASAVAPGVDETVEVDLVPADAGTLVEAGQAAWWDLYTTWEPVVRRAVGRAHYKRTAGIASAAGVARTDVLDELALDAVADTVMLGGAWQRMVDLAVRPSCFTRTDPLHWMHATVYRECWAAVGKAIGDTHRGPALRRVAAAIGSTDPVTVAEHYSSLGRSTASAATAERALGVLRLTPEPTPGVHPVGVAA